MAWEAQPEPDSVLPPHFLGKVSGTEFWLSCKDQNGPPAHAAEKLAATPLLSVCLDGGRAGGQGQGEGRALPAGLAAVGAGKSLEVRAQVLPLVVGPRWP